MNGTVIFGVALIVVGLFRGGSLPLLVAGVVVIAAGAFLTGGRPRSIAPRNVPTDDSPYV